MMELVNDLYAFTKQQDNAPSPQAAAVVREALESLIVMLSPFAPHTAEELWEQFGHTGGIVDRVVAGVRCGSREGRGDRDSRFR